MTLPRRPNFLVPGRGRGRATGELGLIDPRILPARHTQGVQNDRYSLRTTRTGNPRHVVVSEKSLRDILGTGQLVTMSVAIWYKAEAAVNNAHGLICGSDSATANAFGMNFINTTDCVFWRGSAGTASNRSLVTVADATQWHHYCGTYDQNDGSGATVRLFVDGSNSGATNGTINSSFFMEPSAPVAIGTQFWRSGSNTTYAGGDFRDAMLWNRQLTSGEVVSLYNGGQPPNQLPASLASGLLLWWKLGDTPRERADLRAIDVTGHGHDGILTTHVTSVADLSNKPTFAISSP